MADGKLPKRVADEMALDEALGILNDNHLCVKYDLDERQLKAVRAQPAFQRKVIAHREEMEDEGKKFKVEARKKAADMLNELADIAKDRRAAALSRVRAAQAMIEYADYPMVSGKEAPGTSKVQLVINTNLSLGAETTPGGTYTIEARPERITDDAADLV